MDTKTKLDAMRDLSFEQRKVLKAETKKVADQLRAAGFEIFGAGYGAITMRLKPEDAGYTLVPIDDARELLSA